MVLLEGRREKGRRKKKKKKEMKTGGGEFERALQNFRGDDPGHKKRGKTSKRLLGGVQRKNEITS